MKTLHAGLCVLVLSSLAGCGQQLVEFGDRVVPTVTTTDPANGATNVNGSRTVNATFSEQMDAATLSGTTFTVKQGTTPVSGTVTYAGMTATFTPAADLPASAYTATIASAAKSAGSATALASDYVWTFTTTAGSGPAVTSTDPGNSSTGVATNKQITATFNRAMTASTINAASFTLKQGATSIPGAVTYTGTTAKFVPTAPLAANTVYDATITIAAKDLAGAALGADYKWTFTTAGGPAVVATDPLNLATGVTVNKHPSAIFNRAMDPLTITTSTFTLKQGANPPIAGSVSYAGTTATFSPTNPLANNTTYTATVTTGAKDTGAIPLAADFVWTFTTETAPPPPLAINLRGAASFGLASRAGLTSTGVTVVNGDVALHPTPTCTDSTGNAGASQTCLVKTYSSTTGLTVNGSIYFAGDPFDNGGTANSVTNDLQIAWNEGKNKVPTQPAIAGDQMDLKTFVPGVYHNANLGLAAGGTATLDGGNDSNAVFIFQVDASFTDSGTLLLPSKIVLVNGAQARNVWFVIGSALTIGAGTTWKGNVLAGGTVTVNNSSTVLGRVLAGAAGAGAITLTGAASPSVTTVTVPQ